MALRLTYREKQSGVCYQKVVRDRAADNERLRLLFPSPPIPNLKTARVRRIERPLAWKVISHYEWLGTLPPCSEYYGIFFDDYCGGVACYTRSTGASAQVPKFLDLPQSEFAYLCRGACVHWAPLGTASKLINRSAEMTGRSVAIAFADTDAGEIGTVYQAAGWTCFGRNRTIRKGDQLISPKGRVINIRNVGSTANRFDITWTQAYNQFVINGWTAQTSNKKIRYAKLLKKGKQNKRLVSLFKNKAIPYPKRAKSIDSDAVDKPVERGQLVTDLSALQSLQEITGV